MSCHNEPFDTHYAEYNSILNILLIVYSNCEKIMYVENVFLISLLFLYSGVSGNDIILFVITAQKINYSRKHHK